jgi:hypothetical protein
VLLRDEEVLTLLNQRELGQGDTGVASYAVSHEEADDWLSQARLYASTQAGNLRLPFLKPLIRDLALFWPQIRNN